MWSGKRMRNILIDLILQPEAYDSSKSMPRLAVTPRATKLDFVLSIPPSSSSLPLSGLSKESFIHLGLNSSEEVHSNRKRLAHKYLVIWMHNLVFKRIVVEDLIRRNYGMEYQRDRRLEFWVLLRLLGDGASLSTIVEEGETRLMQQGSVHTTVSNWSIYLRGWVIYTMVRRRVIHLTAVDAGPEMLSSEVIAISSFKNLHELFQLIHLFPLSVSDALDSESHNDEDVLLSINLASRIGHKIHCKG
ncbi:hypothetical protein Tco_0445481 [Tanacetum coccineum]